MATTTFTKERAELILEQVRGGMSFAGACRIADVPLSTACGWRDQNSEFSNSVDRAKSESERELVAVLREAATGYTERTEKIVATEDGSDRVEETLRHVKQPRYAAWLLARQFPERWSEKYQVDRLVRSAVNQVLANIMEASSDRGKAEIASIIGSRPEIVEADLQALAEASE